MPPASEYMAQAAIGLGGSLVYGSQRLYTALFTSDQELTPKQKAKAWSEFANTLFAGPLFAAVLTWPIVHLSGNRTPWPPVSLTVGLLCSVTWPKFVEAAPDLILGKGKRILQAIFEAEQK